MAKVAIKNVYSSDLAAPSQGYGFSGGASSIALMTEDDRPIQVWLHRLEEGVETQWSAVPFVRAVFLWEGAIEINGKLIRDQGAAIIEHGAAAVGRALGGGALLLEFHRPPGHEERPGRAGGHVHVLGRDRAPRCETQIGGLAHHLLYADGHCPNCEVWMHESAFPAGFSPPRHSHSEDEVIIITAGQMKFGSKVLERGSVLAINKGAVYTFTSGDDGVSFVEFRSRVADMIPVDADVAAALPRRGILVAPIPPHIVAAQ